MQYKNLTWYFKDWSRFINGFHCLGRIIYWVGRLLRGDFSLSIGSQELLLICGNGRVTTKTKIDEI